MFIVPLKAVPSQTLAITLDGQLCKITVRTIGPFVYFSLEGAAVTRLVRDRARILIDSKYRGFRGDFAFIDTQGLDDPAYTGLGDRWQLVYYNAGE